MPPSPGNDCGRITPSAHSINDFPADGPADARTGIDLLPESGGYADAVVAHIQVDAIVPPLVGHGQSNGGLIVVLGLGARLSSVKAEKW